jgi:hypothetical protein
VIATAWRTRVNPLSTCESISVVLLPTGATLARCAPQRGPPVGHVSPAGTPLNGGCYFESVTVGATTVGPFTTIVVEPFQVIPVAVSVRVK